VKIYGFSYIRNGEIIGYPFLEAFQCLSEFCDHLYVAVGDSTDDTREKVASLPNVTIIDTVWGEENRKHGHIFSQQANAALDAVRKDHADGWALHIQADQIFLKQDFEELRKDFEKAEALGCDGLSMRYIHFWKNTQKIVYEKNWFPCTITATKVNSKGKSVGDSQSLGECEKVYESDVTVFHYSHALGEKNAEKKRRALSRWWHPDEDIDADVKKFYRRTAQEPVVSYLGPHPLWIQERFHTKLETVDSCWIVGEKKMVQEYLPRIAATVVHVVPSLKDVPDAYKKKAVILNPTIWQKIFYPSSVPMGMRWPGTRPWTFEFRFLLLLSEKGIPMDIDKG
jgi:hypothetical protein